MNAVSSAPPIFGEVATAIFPGLDEDVEDGDHHDVVHHTQNAGVAGHCGRDLGHNGLLHLRVRPRLVHAIVEAVLDDDVEPEHLFQVLYLGEVVYPLAAGFDPQRPARHTGPPQDDNRREEFKAWMNSDTGHLFLYVRGFGERNLRHG